MVGGSPASGSRRQNVGGHGAARDPEEAGSSRLVVDTRSDVCSVTSHSSYLVAQSPTGRSMWPPLMEMKRRHLANVEALHGKLADVPRHWLWIRFLNNSFFARRLMRSGMLLTMGLLAGLLFYNWFVERWLQDHQENDSEEYDNCRSVVTFSALIYQTLPAAIILSLPGSGLRAFEPFKREDVSATATISGSNNNERASTGVAVIRRCFIFQLCEVLAVMMLFFDMGLVLYFLYVLFTGALTSCGNFATQIFGLGAAFCYAGLFTVLYYFTRYREHIKMQLGAFAESSQTGDLRKHGDLRSEKRLDSVKKRIAVVRTRLYYATRRGDLDEMRDILEYAKDSALVANGFPREAYAAPKITWKFFARSAENPVHIAAGLGNTRALELLHEYDFDLGVLDKVQRVVVSTGGFFWHFIRMIVKRPQGSDQDSADSIFHTTLMTPLHCAVSTGQVETVRWLLERGAHPGTLAQASFRSNRVPPLFLAEHAEIARELLVHGADPLAIPDPGFMNTMTPLQLAYVRGNYAVAQELEEWGGDVALTPFHLAAARNNVLAVRKFIARKTDVDCLGEMGYVGLNRRTPLHWAAISGSTEAVDALLQAGADPNFQDARGRSPLHWAARLNKLEVVRSLLRAGAEPNLADGEFMTPLVCAASALDVSRDIFTELTTAGGDIGYQLPTTGDTALHVAVREENEASALAALASGGDLMRMNNEGLRPLDCTASTRLLFELKRAAGQRDVMISYTHSHLEFARKLRQSLEEANVTTWLDLMDPSGIGGGAVWREEIARGITNASLVLCVLTEDYASSEWCLKELALAKQVGTPILAVSTEGAVVDENLQVYLYTRQIIPFEPAIVGLRHDDGRVEYEYDESRFRSQMHLLLDGVRDEVEKRRYFTKQKNVATSNSRPDRGGDADAGERSNRGTMLNMLSDTLLSQSKGSWEPVDSPSRRDWHERKFVFISHGDKHIPFVHQLSAQVVEAGIACYIDRDVSGEDFYTRIQLAQEAISRCSCFVVLVSRQTMANELVRDQLAFAEDKGRPIFPVVLNDLEPGLDKRYTLVRSDLFHFMANGMGFQSSFNQLVQGIREYCQADRRPGSFTGSEGEDTRNLDSIEGLDGQVDLASTCIRM
jgi:ankyrin repeat protein